MDPLQGEFSSLKSGQDNFPPQESQGASQHNESRTEGGSRKKGVSFPCLQIV